MTGKILNQRYRLDSELGRGGMGIVYRGHDLLLERDVIIKVLNQARLDNACRERLLREARATAKLDHPNIISVHDAGEADGVPFIVMQYFVGKSLHEVMANPTHESSEARSLPIGTPPMERGISLPQALEIMVQVCRALEHAHQHGIIHRDVKPENVIVVKEGEHWTARLTDFGLARSLASRRTAEGTIIGTVFYMAPEQALGQPLDARSDLYALGVMLYELTTGSLPFSGDDPLTVLSQHLNAPLIPPRIHNSEIPIALDTLICRLMAKKPEDRLASAADVRLSLEELAQPATAPQEVGKLHHNLPTSITSFIGRERQIEAIANLLRHHRLVTLTGSGGVGKTRLGVEAARRMLPEYLDGVWLVELAPLADAALVTHTVARSLGMSPTSNDPILPSLLYYLKNRRLLLVLDNCEHVVEVCARLADQLLPECPQLSILATSREPLGITGEAIFNAPPLTVPQAGQLPTLENLSQYEAIQLFVERAATTSPGFTLTLANFSAVAQVCQRLDGIPLAIEMAAARTRMLQVEEIASRLADRFQLLTSGSRTGLPRHQTLRACLDWSYELLSEAERALLQRLSVFASGWVLEAAEAVGCGEGIQACDVPELLGMLVDKSLVQTSSEAGGLSRFRMLETIRQHAQEKLAESGEAEATRDRHLQYYLALAEGVAGKLRSPRQVLIQERLDTELDNLRLALEWSMQSQGGPVWNPEPGLRLAAALQWFWHLQCRDAEGLAWLERLLASELDSRGGALASTSRLKIRARALQVAGQLAMVIDERPKATSMAEESRDIFQELGPDGKWDYAYSLYILGCVEPDLARSKALADECLRRSRSTGDRFVESEALTLLGGIAQQQEDFHQAQAYYEANLAICREIGDQSGEAQIYRLFGMISMSQWDFVKARLWFEESLSLYTANRNIFGMYTLRDFIGALDWLEGKYEQAASIFEQSLSFGRGRGDQRGIVGDLSYLGELALSQGDIQRAAELLSENLAVSQKWGKKFCIAFALYDLGLLDLAQGEPQQAARRFSEAQALFQESGSSRGECLVIYHLGKAEHALGDRNAAREHLRESLYKLPYTDIWWPKAMAIEALAFLADDEQQRERAVRLLGASEAWHAKCRYIRLPCERQEREARITTLRTVLGEEALAAAFAEGQAMTREQAVEYAKGV